MQAIEPTVETEAISGWLRRWAPLIPGGEVLDLACGAAATRATWLSLGHPVIALDRDPETLAKAAGPGITTSLVDLEDAGRRMAFRARPLCRHRRHQLSASAADGRAWWPAWRPMAC